MPTVIIFGNNHCVYDNFVLPLLLVVKQNVTTLGATILQGSICDEREEAIYTPSIRACS